MRFDDLPQSDNIEDRRGDGGGGGGGFGMPMGRGGVGIGTIIVLGIVGYALGIDPPPLVGGGRGVGGGGSSYQQPSQPGKTGAPTDDMGKFVSRILGSADVVWTQTFEQSGQRYRKPTLVMFSGATRRAPTPAARRSPPWGRSIVRPTRRSISTPPSSAISSAASAVAMPARVPASSRRRI